MTHEQESNLELSQETLEDAFTTLGEALIVNGDDPEREDNEIPPEHGPTPYSFRKDLPVDFIRDNLLDTSESDYQIIDGHAIFISKRRLELEDQETRETVAVEIALKLPGSQDITLNRSAAITRIMSTDDLPQFTSYVSEEYSNSSGKRVSRGNHDFADGMQPLPEVIEDMDETFKDLTVSDLEGLHKVAEFIQEKDRSSES